MANLTLVRVQPGCFHCSRFLWIFKLCGLCVMLFFTSVMLRNAVDLSCTLLEQRHYVLAQQGTENNNRVERHTPYMSTGSVQDTNRVETPPSGNGTYLTSVLHTENSSDVNPGNMSLPFQLSGASTYLNLLDYEPPTFLANFKNPCWYEELTTSQPYPKIGTIPKVGHEKRSRNVIAFENKLKQGKPWRLRCLPYFYVAGFVKSGTTEIFHNLKNHPLIPDANNKEIHWWSRFRNHIVDNRDMASPIRDYVDVFDSSSIAIESYTLRNNIAEKAYHPMIIGDGSTTCITSIWSWWNKTENKERQLCRDSPAFNNAHYIRHVTPNAKIIVSMRNPADRLYSHWTLRNVTSPELFHGYVGREIGAWNLCMKNNPISTCAWCYHTPESVFLPSIYFPFLKEWLDVFPREQFLFVKLEEFSKDREAGLNEMFNFLGLDPVAQTVLINHSLNVRVGCETCRYPPMLNTTRAILDEFYHPYNEMTAKLLEDDKWLFKS